MRHGHSTVSSTVRLGAMASFLYIPVFVLYSTKTYSEGGKLSWTMGLYTLHCVSCWRGSEPSVEADGKLCIAMHVHIWLLVGIYIYMY